MLKFYFLEEGISMNIMKKAWFKKLLVPGIVFQSIVIAGGYGTGRELVEFFLANGTLGGFLGMSIVTTLAWSLVCAVTFEFARVFKAYDYRTIMKRLLGKAWFLYEICYLGTMMLVLSVVASSAGEIMLELFGIPYTIGVAIMMVAVAMLVLFGTQAVVNFLSYWSFVLYAVYILFLVVCFTKLSGSISASFVGGEIGSEWVMGGLKYAFYNLGVVPAILYTVQSCETRKEAICAGLIAGVVAVLPGIFLLIPMMGFYPQIVDQALPVNFILNKLNMPWLQYLFQIVLFGTLIETGAGFIQALIERIKATIAEKNQELPKWVVPTTTITTLALGAFITKYGLVALIAKGYGTMTWGFLIVYVIPIFTYGIYQIYKATSSKAKLPTNVKTKLEM